MMKIVRFELSRWLRRPAIYIYALVFFLLGFMVMQLAGGAFDSVRFNISGDAVYVNSPGVLEILFGVFSYMGIVIVAAITAPVAFRDFRANTTELLFAMPITKQSYVLGGFMVAWILNLIAFVGLPVGLYVGSLMPYLNQALFGPFVASAYVSPILYKIIPNLFFITALFYGLTLLRRNVLMNWLMVLGLYLLYGLGQKLMADLDTRTLAALLDPFGVVSSVVVSAGNSAEDMNNQSVTPESVYLWNRILWVSIGVLTLLFTLWRFRFSAQVRSFLVRRKKNTEKVLHDEQQMYQVGSGFPKAATKVSWKLKWQCWMSYLRLDCRWMFHSVFFWLILLLGVVFMVLSSKVVGKFYDTETYPVTYQVLYILNGTLKLFVYLFIALFSGELLWRERARSMHELVEVQPGVRTISLLSKFATLILGVISMLGVLIVCGVLVQAARGYYQFELPLYLMDIFGFRLVDYVLFAVMAFVLHLFIPNKYGGLVAILVFFLLRQYILSPLLGLNLLVYGQVPQWTYSDMNGFGYNGPAAWWFYGYWLLVATIMLTLASGFWQGGTEKGFKARCRRYKKISGRSFRITLALGITGFLVLGGWLTYQTVIVNDFYFPGHSKELSMAYEKKYKKYEKLPQPKIVDVFIDADLHPEDKWASVKGVYWLKNKTNVPIDQLYLNTNNWLDGITLERDYSVILNDDELDFWGCKFDAPLAPGDSCKLHFVMNSVPKGLSNSGYNTAVEQNGTFFYNSLFPSIGYLREREMSNPADRAHNRMSERPLVLPMNDSLGIQRNFISGSADFIRYEAILRTAPDQIAVTPGKLINEYHEKGRNVFHYKTECPMVNYYAVLSGRYHVKRSLWQSADTTQQPVELSVLYHPAHTYNLEMMIQAMKDALDYYTQVYTPYQFSQLRVVEFPRFSSFAQSFPNMIPYSEGIGFIADLTESGNTDLAMEDWKINYPYWFISHEIAHQWWAHQLIAADVEGAQFLMESITQYSAYKVLERKYGKEMMQKVFREEWFKYLSSRKSEPYEERPAYRVADYQSQIYYQKGAMALYHVGESLPESLLENTLNEFLIQEGYTEAPYPSSMQFVDLLKRNAPDSLINYITDALERITFYDFKLDSAAYKRTPRLVYEVQLQLEGVKFFANGKGKEQNVPFSEYIPIGFYTADGELFQVEEVLAHEGQNKLALQLTRRPDKVVVDPFYKMMTKDYKRERIPLVSLQ